MSLFITELALGLGLGGVYTLLAQGLLDLYEASFEPRWLEAAIELSERLEALFGDPAGGGWFTTAGDHEKLLAREKPTHDGAEPSGASVALQIEYARRNMRSQDDRSRSGTVARSARRWT